MGAVGVGIDGSGDVDPPSGMTPPPLPPSLSMADWGDLLGAMKARLLLGMEDLPQPADPLWNLAPAQRLRSSVLESVAALDLLHTALRHELDARLMLEMEVFDAQAAFAQACAELASTHARAGHARHGAAHDAPPSWPNRGQFHELLDAALAPQRPAHSGVALLYLDLDGFKPIHQLHGPAIGDEVLRIVALRLTRAMRANDMVSRLGGDEFACLLADPLNREQLARLACKLFDAVSAPLTVGKLWLSVAPSIGIALCTNDGTTAADLLQRAAAALAFAKLTQCGLAFQDAGSAGPSPLAAGSGRDGHQA